MLIFRTTLANTMRKTLIFIEYFSGNYDRISIVVGEMKVRKTPWSRNWFELHEGWVDYASIFYHTTVSAMT